MYYIFNKDNKCICKCDYEPNIEDLETRSEYFLYCEEDYQDLFNISSLEDEVIYSKPSLPSSVEIRKERDLLVQRVSNEIERRLDKGEDPAKWRTYRQFLRDIPEQSNFPEKVDWGQPPDNFTGK